MFQRRAVYACGGDPVARRVLLKIGTADCELVEGKYLHVEIEGEIW